MKIENVFLSLALALTLTAIPACTKQSESSAYRGMRELVCTTNGRVTMRSQQVGYIQGPYNSTSDTYEFYRTYDDRFKHPIGRYRQRMGEYCVIYRVNPTPPNF